MGFGAETEIQTQLRKDSCSKQVVDSLKIEAAKFISALVSKINERCPLRSVILRTAIAFDPTQMLLSKSTEITRSKVKALIHKLVSMNVLTSVKALIHKLVSMNVLTSVKALIHKLVSMNVLTSVKALIHKLVGMNVLTSVKALIHKLVSMNVLTSVKALIHKLVSMNVLTFTVGDRAYIRYCDILGHHMKHLMKHLLGLNEKSAG